MRFLATVLALAGSTVVGAQPRIRLKSRAIDPAAEIRTPLGHHYVVQFRANPGPEVHAELARRGIRILNAIPDFALLVSSAAAPDLGGLDVAWAGSLAASDKLSRELARTRHAAYLVIFHPDISPAEARRVAEQAGFFVLEHPDLLASHLLVAGSYPRLHDLAGHDEVAYILPASPDLLAGHRLVGCAGALTSAGAVGAYVEVSSGWGKNSFGRVDLRYAFQSLTPKIEENAERNEVGRALAEWARYTNLDFSAGSDPFGWRTISVLFARGAHGDRYPFDGPGATLAHTFYPAPPNSEPIAADMHLDADENWRVGGDIDLFSVALHEAGHALGLGHSDRPGAVMYPYYRQLFGLSDDDIAGVRDLYGSGSTAPTPSASPQPVLPTPPVPSTDRTPPALRIVWPGSTIVATYATSIALRGTAADNRGVTRVIWANSNGGSGLTAGTTFWTAQIPLLIGTNMVTIRAFDAAGNSSWRAVTVVRRQTR